MSTVRPRVVALAGAYAAALMGLAATQPISNADTFGHLAQGRVIAENGGPPALDPFSFFRPEPQPWPNYEWLSDLMTWGVYQLGGYDALIFVAAALAAIAAALVVTLGARLGGESAAWLTSFFLVASIPAVRFRLSARPHLLTAPLAGLYLHLLVHPDLFKGRARTQKTVAALFFAQILWANLHGSHLLGIAIVAIAALVSAPDWQRAGRLGALALLLGAASCVTPFGPALTMDAVRHVFDPEMRAVVSEWHDLSSSNDWTRVTMTVIAGCMAIALLRVWPRKGAHRLLFVVAAVLVASGLRSLRFVLDGATFAAPVLGLALGDLLDAKVLEAKGAKAPFSSLPRAPFVAALAAMVGALAAYGGSLADPTVPLGTGLDTRTVPAEAMEHLAAVHPEARLFGSMPTSWYALFAAPRVRVLIDGRAPFYGAEHVSEMERAISEEGRLAPLLRRHDVDTVILQHTAPDEHAASVAMRADAAFVRTWMDASYSVFIRRDRVDASACAALDPLPSSLDGGAILGAEPDAVPALRAATDALGEGPEARALASFVRSMLRMRAFARQGGWAGFRAPTTPAEEQAVELAFREVHGTYARVGSVPSVIAQAMLIAAVSCHLDEASRLLDEARVEGDTRETLFGAAEIDLRTGRTEATRAFLAAARSIPGGASDAWVLALEASLDAPAPCSASLP